MDVLPQAQGLPWDRKGLHDLTWHGSGGYWYNGPIWVIAMVIFLVEKAVGVDRVSLFLSSLLALGPAYRQSSRSRNSMQHFGSAMLPRSPGWWQSLFLMGETT